MKLEGQTDRELILINVEKEERSKDSDLQRSSGIYNHAFPKDGKA